MAYTRNKFIYEKLFWYDVNKETVGVCVCLIYLMLIYGWVGYFYPIHKNKHYADMQQEH